MILADTLCIMLTTQTFLRQKVNLASALGNSGYKDFHMKKEGEPSILSSGHSLLQSKAESAGSIGFNGADIEKSTDHRVNMKVAEVPDRPQDLTDLVSPGILINKGLIKTSGMDGSSMITSGLTKSKSGHGSVKVNENINGSGVLRYALHLRFLCPFPKKYTRTVQRCKSDPFSGPTQNNKNLEGERRFYLYNDMRVVFPQRHSDADEGKVCKTDTSSDACDYLLPVYIHLHCSTAQLFAQVGSGQQKYLKCTDFLMMSICYETAFEYLGIFITLAFYAL